MKYGILITCPAPTAWAGDSEGPARASRGGSRSSIRVWLSPRGHASASGVPAHSLRVGLGHRVASPLRGGPGFFFSEFSPNQLLFSLERDILKIMERNSQIIQIAVRALIDALPENSRPIGEAIQSLLVTEMDRAVAEAANSAVSAPPYPQVRLHVWEQGGSARTTTMMRCYMCEPSGEWTRSRDTAVSRPWAQQVVALGLATRGYPE